MSLTLSYLWIADIKITLTKSIGCGHEPILSYLWLDDMKLTLSCLWGADMN